MLLILTVLPVTFAACHFNSLSAGDTCSATWSNLVNILHPSQQAVGYGWIARKLAKDFTSQKNAQVSMDASPIPVVIGPNQVPYIINDHHTLSALHYSGYSNVTVEIDVVCNWSDFNGTMAEFYDKMTKHNFLLGIGRPSGQPNTLPKTIDGSTIGTQIGSLPDDPWRGLAGFVRKIRSDDCPKSSKFCLRAYDRQCNPVDGRSTPFFEFRWAYFINAAYLDPFLWDSLDAFYAFTTLFATISQPSKGPDYEDPDKWQEVADLLQPLCRGLKAGVYTLPSSLGTPFADVKLPGYVQGPETQLDHDDPDCANPQCPA